MTSSSTPRVSVITPVKNRPELVNDAINSVRTQTFADLEMIVVDDVSTDRTPQVLDDQKKADCRIRVILRRGESAGPSACRNLGFSEARGDLVIFLDSDDLLLPDCLEKRVAYLVARPELDVAVSGLWIFRESVDERLFVMNRETGEEPLERYLRHDYLWQTTGPTYRRRTWERLGPWREDMRVSEDIELAVRLLAKGLRWGWVGREDYFYRAGDAARETLTQDFWSAERLPDHERLVEACWGHLIATERTGMRLRELIAGNLFWLAQKWNRVGRPVEARRCWARGLDWGVLSRRRYREGGRFLRWQGTKLGPFLMNWLAGRWPETMFVWNRRTLCQTRPEDRDEPLPPRKREDLHPDHAYREILAGGATRYVTRRILPRMWKRTPMMPAHETPDTKTV